MAAKNSLLEARLAKSESKDASLKVRSLAQRSNSGQLSGYSTLLGAVRLSEQERTLLHELLIRYRGEGKEASLVRDLEELSFITQEVKSIHHQSILLHGERIERVQKILIGYAEGAFSSWLVVVYGNRQTPYNFLLYYQLYTALEDFLREKVQSMPKQAVYTLASRDVPFMEKARFIEEYSGEKKQELLRKLRQQFPLAVEDGRRGRSLAGTLLHDLKKCTAVVEGGTVVFSEGERRTLLAEVKRLLKSLSQQF